MIYIIRQVEFRINIIKLEQLNIFIINVKNYKICIRIKEIGYLERMSVIVLFLNFLSVGFKSELFC